MYFLIEKDIAKMKAQTAKLNEFIEMCHRHRMKYDWRYQFTFSVWDRFSRQMSKAMKAMQNVKFAMPQVDPIKIKKSRAISFLKFMQDHKNDIAAYYGINVK